VVIAGSVCGLAAAAAPAQPVDAPDTWTLLQPLPERVTSPVFAIAVDPSDGQSVLAGTPTGRLYRSTDGGTSWRLAASGLGGGVLALAFDPARRGTALAGVRDGGVWRSGDGGASWQREPGSERRTVRSFDFAAKLTVAGTDNGVLVSRQGGPWSPAGLGQVAVSAVAVAAPSRVVAGGDRTRGGEALPLYQSADGGQSWQPVAGAVGGSSMVATLGVGPAAASGDRPLLMGTNAGLYTSTDGGASWQAVTGGGALPATDYTELAFAGGDPRHFYVGSDGGASPQGGLWSTSDGGGQFASLSPPVASVTALAASTDRQPALYVATFRPIDHAVMLWRYQDAGGPPQPPRGGVPSPPAGSAPAQRPHGAGTHTGWLLALARGPEAPYLVLGLVAATVLLLAALAYARRARNL
jgi:photosystem II stability/assembly factor-like uncharacterized protein